MGLSCSASSYLIQPDPVSVCKGRGVHHLLGTHAGCAAGFSILEIIEFLGYCRKREISFFNPRVVLLGLRASLCTTVSPEEQVWLFSLTIGIDSTQSSHYPSLHGFLGFPLQPNSYPSYKAKPRIRYLCTQAGVFGNKEVEALPVQWARPSSANNKKLHR